MNDNLSDAALLDNPRAVIGGNLPPEPMPETSLEEDLEAGFAFGDRIATLIVRAKRLPERLANEVQLGFAADLTKEARNLYRDIEDDRAAKKKPYLDAGRMVDSFYAVSQEQVEALGKTIRGLMDAYNREVAAAARRRAEEEARQAREEEQRRADLAQKAAEANRHHHAALHEDKADEAAERALQAEAQARQSSNDLTRVRSSAGTVASATTVWHGEITDLAKLDLEALRPYLTRDVLQKAVDAFVRINTRGATTAPVLAGARIFSDLKTRIR